MSGPTVFVPTSSHYGILTAGSVQAEQARTLTAAQTTDACVQSCSSLDPTTKAQWGIFMAGLTVWCQTPVVNVWTPWMPSNAVVVTADTGDTMMSWEAQLQGWQQRLSASCPCVGPILSQFNPQNPTAGSIVTALGYAAVIAGFLGTAYVVSKVVEFIPKPAAKTLPPKPEP